MDTSETKIAIVAALEREVRPLVKGWTHVRREYQGRSFVFHESGRFVVVCGGIGPEPARRAAEAVVQMYAPSALVSAGLAGALRPELKVGNLITAGTVIDCRDGSRAQSESGQHVLLTFDGVAGAGQKEKLAKAYSADAVDMEASAVAKCAQVHQLHFYAVKAISDTLEFQLPPVAQFVNDRGAFQTARFAVLAALRPWLWKGVWQLARNSTVASRALCDYLSSMNSDIAPAAAQASKHAGAPTR